MSEDPKLSAIRQIAVTVGNVDAALGFYREADGAAGLGQDRMLHGFDAVVVLTGRAPGTPASLVVREGKVPTEQG